MEFIVDLEKLKEIELTPSEYCFLMCIHKKIEYPCINDIKIKELEGNGWCKVLSEEIVVRHKFLELVKDDVSPSNIRDWIQDWRLLWPEGVKTNGRPVRGDKAGCNTKMSTFVRENPKVTKEQIFDATKIYIFEKAQKGYSHMTCADYFIKKDGISLLAALVENLQGKESYLKKMEGSDNGLFHKEV